jgi:hypothetical protein
MAIEVSNDAIGQVAAVIGLTPDEATKLLRVSNVSLQHPSVV